MPSPKTLDDLKQAIITASMNLIQGTISGVTKEDIETVQNVYEDLFNNISSDEAKLRQLLTDINKFDITAFRTFFNTSKVEFKHHKAIYINPFK